ncbi:hypothetical protein SERLA73DRAFT_176828 [Serpula lacrymans var. lacrymans S7.3]|uniref:Uncharacterized protein n=2 Tax=Serpula lacrymans var. lacrymans TaxID=341189 RepID=F8PQ52_SERL3|nr:uncharacterized protein SERLADRAFT_460104 [Serpula lacrymans var. lacrymans S7.9]EGO01517.1 hypothetical protein SERLA73DRAFT_176828 [Serpula lacrymans var. lacrymans S7.3]EGO27170.1 hypothetical protein SERLADRAFT_460104 [Serpula lacrymans var. lacrymans S7.9]
MAAPHSSKRSFTGHHVLLPASEQDNHVLIPLVPTRTLMSWTFGRGTVIYRIWPAVLLHTLFAAGVVYLSLETKYNLALPPVLLTVLGLVIGFVISYRASSGYDRYWMGRSSWSDVTCTARSFSRLIWFHVPPRLTSKSLEELGTEASAEEILTVMTEKRFALDLVEAFVVALKHHLRGEVGIYYEDLYPLVHQLHGHHAPHPKDPAVIKSPTLQPPSDATVSSSSTSRLLSKRGPTNPTNDIEEPSIVPINAYGTFGRSETSFSTRSRTLVRRPSILSFTSSHGDHHTILPSNLHAKATLFSSISAELIPFESFFSSIERWIKRIFGLKSSDRRTHAKHRPRVAGGGENLPLEILRCLSDWCAVLEERQTAGSSLGGMHGCISSFESSLSALEKILTTPLPLVFSVHIKHTVWIYLFFLPFQLVDQFRWHTIAGVLVAAFIYLGLVAAGEEIEQPFGYDDNDLDLDLFCREIIHADIELLKATSCNNSHVDSQFTRTNGMISIVAARERVHVD